MRITFLGGADEVGASSIFIEIAGQRLLVDAGIRPSPKARWGLAGDQLPDLSLIEQAGGLDAILVTHAHTDHTGALELVVGHFPQAPVYTTPVTMALCRVLHQDARRIMQSRWEEEGELPLFDDLAVEKLMAAFVPLEFRQRLPLADGLVATFYPAGHIAGAAMLALDSDEGRVLVSGDISVTPQRTVDGMRPPAFTPDVLILESTYGGRLHANRAVEERRLVDTVTEVAAGGGKVLIPAFALGRAQELLLILSEFRRQGQLPAVPVWADGMVRAVCQAYSGFPEALPLPLQERGARFYDANTRPVESRAQRDQLIWQPEPAVIVSSSGMLAGGPALQYARALAGQPQHAILLTGYQDEEAPGRRLQEMAARGHGTLQLGRDRVAVQCRLGMYSLSAHADEGQLISLVEALDPAVVLLVHGDEAARASLEQALEERGRSVRLVRAGQALEFAFRIAPTARAGTGLGQGRPVDLEALWRAVAGPGGGYLTAAELARAWWGEPTPAQTAEIEAALERQQTFFSPDGRRAQVYRAHTQAQVELARRRRELLGHYAETAIGGLAGQLLVWRDSQGAPQLGRLVEASSDRFWLEGQAEPRWPEEIMALLGLAERLPDASEIAGLVGALQPQSLLVLGLPQPLDDLLLRLPADLVGRASPAATKAAMALALLRAGATATPQGYILGVMGEQAATLEPNEALALARRLLPPEARLRRCGYHLDRQVLQLAFDFPAVAASQYAAQLAQLQAASGWQVEVDAEANQSALAALARQVLPAEWQITKGPAIHRADQRVALTARPSAEDEARSHQTILERAQAEFQATSGWELEVSLAAPLQATAARPSAPRMGAADAPWEINAAYAEIKDALVGSTLYRVSLKNDQIVLAFVSPQVGARHRDEIEALSQRIGWPLAISPAPNQGLILETARRQLLEAGLEIVKGPSIYIERGEVGCTVKALPPKDTEAALLVGFEEQTGYRLALTVLGGRREGGGDQGSATSDRREAGGNRPVGADNRQPAAMEAGVLMIPLARIRLSNYHQGLAIDPEKLRKVIARAQRQGQVSPPVQVRRAGEGYRLVDGLYRLRAAESLGWEQIAAEVVDS